GEPIMRAISFTAVILLVAKIAVAQPSALNRVEQSLQSPPAASGVGEPVPGFAGFEPDEEISDGRGVHVKAVRPSTPADKAGLKSGDVIVNVDGRPIPGLDDFERPL